MKKFDNFHVEKVAFLCFKVLNAQITRKISTLNFLSSALRALVSIFQIIPLLQLYLEKPKQNWSLLNLRTKPIHLGRSQKLMTRNYIEILVIY